ncbi:ABC transporter permease [Glutamicibacter protophormiae]|uniref:Simple sugar transport system permease protein n=2 Tax=Glutamicibacter protophormiae TaxID=37930 RepID=A0ABS4XQ56_GLUPR|nr:ABC transporter permease [Glutamicibacter protophormiae]MBP2398642.1 simple sugar transport system permease protein [Glutamicibacter protophormiae]WPR65473.1 ABC transporter permease [Glutamicibacter protophormiae]WPR68971.1 ABC transporter permease [Glutamicibacter protophormiae]GGL81282.1 ABC transporter permease [Glutamicibacter protophormiae]
MTTTVPSKSAISVLPSKKTPIIFSVLAVIVLVSFGLLGNSQTASFSLSSAGDAFSLPDLVFPGRASNIVIGVLLAALAAYSWMLRSKGRVLPVWSVAVGAVLFVLAFLIWVVSGANINSISLASLLAGGVVLAVPLVFGSLSGVLSERSGVVNIAIEGQLLGGAFTAAIVASVTQNAFAGLIAAGLAGAVVSLVLALFSIKYLVNQIIVGVVLNVLVSGITGFLFTTVMQEDPQLYNSPVHLPTIAIPGLSAIPVIGPILFKQSVIGYLMYIAVFLVWFGLYKTRWGLRVRAVGEHPKAADTLGIKVNRTRFWNVTLGGIVAGIGGSFFTLVAIDSFTKEISGGRGFIALAAVIFGRWNPIGAFAAALLFGFADNLQVMLTIIGTPVPSQFMAMMPYLVTIFAVAGLVGRSRGPAAVGDPYVKE